MLKQEFKILLETYIKEHGVLFDDSPFIHMCYNDGSVSHYEQLFDKPMDEGGTPFNGLVYELYPSGKMAGYTFYKNGYHYGDSVEFYESGEVRWLSRHTESENFICEWYRNGNLKELNEHHRSDAPSFFRTTKYNENGELIYRQISCEMTYRHDYQSPDPSCSVQWHENGEFRKITCLSPTSDTFYTEMEFDAQGYPIGFEINPHYCPIHFSAEKQDAFYHLSRFDSEYRFENGILLRRSPTDNRFLKYSGKLVFLRCGNRIERISEYANGILSGAQYLYNHDGQIKEYYCISRGEEYYRHIWWYDHGVIQKVRIYTRNEGRSIEIAFDETGNRALKLE